MPFRSRVSQLLALALLLLSPGAGGLALEVSHPCPGKAATDASATGHTHHTSGHQSGQQGPEHGHRCCCFGACSLALQHAALPAAKAPVSLVVATAYSPVPPPPAQPLLISPPRLLPPATAPPASFS